MQTNKIFKIIVIFVLLGIAIYYVMSRRSSDNAGTVAPSSNTTNTVAPAAPITSTTGTSEVQRVAVEIKNFSFNPGALTIKAGTQVIWTNNDSAPHTITSDSGSLLNSQTISSGQSFSFTFTTAGEADYHCNIHPGMKGKIIVQ